MNLIDVRVTLNTTGANQQIIRERTGKIVKGSKGTYDFLSKELGLTPANGVWGTRDTFIVPVKPQDIANSKDKKKAFDLFDAAVDKFFEKFGYKPNER